jgi:hypothetical protein
VHAANDCLICYIWSRPNCVPINEVNSCFSFKKHLLHTFIHSHRGYHVLPDNTECEAKAKLKLNGHLKSL